MNARNALKLMTIILFVALAAFTMTQGTKAQSEPQDVQIQDFEIQANPTIEQFWRPDYNYSKVTCFSCHFSRGAGGDHMPEAIGVVYNDAKGRFDLTGKGWLASKHSQTNEASTQNTYCAKCHSPMEALPESQMLWDKSGPRFENTLPIAEGANQAVTCAACHPSSAVAKLMPNGRRLGIYQFGKDVTKPEAYEPVLEGQEDGLCLNCHTTKHNEDSRIFSRMYEVGVRCIDCHMAENNGFILGTEVPKRAHDFKVAKNLPFSCGMKGSMTGCHAEFENVEAARSIIAFAKQQHSDKWTAKMKKFEQKQGDSLSMYKFWKQLEAEAKSRAAGN